MYVCMVVWLYKVCVYVCVCVAVCMYGWMCVCMALLVLK